MFLFATQSFVYANSLQKRSPYTVPLLTLSLRSDRTSELFREVSVSSNGRSEYSLIGRFNDLYIRNKRQDVEKFEYAESESGAHNLSHFEAKQLKKVIRSFTATLDILERDLSDKKWDRCLYLDSYLPRFLRGFYFLSCAMFNSSAALPDVGNLPESLYDVSLRSIKSDTRIYKWQKEKDHIIKLIIATKELKYRLRQWELENLSVLLSSSSSKAKVFSYSEQLKVSYGLFIKLYFHL